MSTLEPKHQRTRVASYAIVVDGGKVLLCRLSNIEKHSGKWTLPGGGIEFGEDPEMAMIREVKEETGLDVKSRGLACVDSVTGPSGDVAMHSIRIVYRADVVGGTLQSEVEGSTDLAEWHEIERLSSLPLVDLVKSVVPLLP